MIAFFPCGSYEVNRVGNPRVRWEPREAFSQRVPTARAAKLSYPHSQAP